LKVIPVLDILNGVAVHAMRGERKEYRPLKSVLCASTNPVDVARSFKSLGFDELYVADLDAILGKSGNFALWGQMGAEAGLNLMVDAGIDNMEKVGRVLETGVSYIIVGTETLNDLDFVRRAVKLLNKNRIIVSIDLKNGRILSESETVKSQSPVMLAQTLEKMGVNKIIILDLARVGAEQGVSLQIVRRVLEKTKVEVLTGGGIRGIEDLEELRSVGISGALVATVLHTGKLTEKELKSKGFL